MNTKLPYFKKQSPTKQIFSRVNYLLTEYDKTKDSKYTDELVNMIYKDEIRIKIGKINMEPTLLFKERSLYPNKCSKCSEEIEIGTPIFWFAKEYWHMRCASNEDKKQSYYLECCKKAQQGNKNFQAVMNVLAMENERNEIEEEKEEEISDFRDIDSQDGSEIS